MRQASRLKRLIRICSSRKTVPTLMASKTFFRSSCAAESCSTLAWSSALTVVSSSLTDCSSSLAVSSSSLLAWTSSLVDCSSSLVDCSSSREVWCSSTVACRLSRVAASARRSSWTRLASPLRAVPRTPAFPRAGPFSSSKLTSSSRWPPRGRGSGRTTTLNASVRPPAFSCRPVRRTSRPLEATWWSVASRSSWRFSRAIATTLRVAWPGAGRR
jgi:hypothetical protein